MIDMPLFILASDSWIMTCIFVHLYLLIYKKTQVFILRICHGPPTIGKQSICQRFDQVPDN
jgi:hypothetical protein